MGTSSSTAYSVEDTVEAMASPATPMGSVSTTQRRILARMDTPPATRGVRPSCRAK